MSAFRNETRGCERYNIFDFGSSSYYFSSIVLVCRELYERFFLPPFSTASRLLIGKIKSSETICAETQLMVIL